MITFWEESKFNKNNFCECEQAKATHFQQNGGRHKPISNLPVDLMRINVQQDDEPLVMPTMNESEETETTEQSDVLTIPSTI